MPNSIIISPSGKTRFVSDRGPNKVTGRRIGSYTEPSGNDYIDSFVSVEKTNMLSTGTDTNKITVQLVKEQDGEYLPIENVNPQNIVISVSGINNTVIQPTMRTNQTGITTGSFTTTEVSSSKQISVSVYGVTLTATPIVTTDGGTSSVAPSTPFFQEYFVNGQKNNSNGFTWSTPNSSQRVQVSNEYAYSGSHSLKFIYGPNADQADSSAEQRFNLGRNLTDMWIEYYLRIPENFIHRTQVSGGTNNKFFRIWGDSYSSANKMGASSQYSASFSEGNSGIGFEYNYKTWADGTLGFGPTGFRSGYTPYGTTSMKGQWTRVRMHYQMVSATDADDAVMEMWFNDTKVLNFVNVPQKYDTVKPYWNAGYLMGWANSGYLEETSFYIDAVKFWDENPMWQFNSVNSFIDISRDAATVDGNIDVLLTVTEITGSPQVFFGGVEASNVQILNPTTIKCTVPAHPVGKVNVICGGKTLINPRSNKIGAGFEYLPTASTVFASSDFSSGTLTGTGLEIPVISNGGTVTIMSESAYTGRYSVKTTGVSGDNGSAKIRNATPINITSENNGVYLRFYHYMPLTTLANIGDQIKTHLFRQTTGDGQPGWLMTGIGPDFPDGNANETNYVTFVDNGIRNINSGSGGTVNQGRSGVTAGAWREFIYWQYYNTPSLTGSAKMWIDGKLQFEVTSSYMGSEALLYEAEMGIAYQQNTIGETKVFIDDVFIGNGFPTAVVPVNETDSFVSTNKTNILSNGVDSADIIIQLMKLVDGEYIPLAYVDPTNKVVIGASGTDNIIKQPTMITDTNGITTASFTTTEVSSSKIITVTAFGKTLTDTAVVTTDAPPTSSGGIEPFFSDNFSNGQKNNSNGVVWSSGGTRVSVSAINPRTPGGYSLRHRYGPDVLGNDSSAEQRFNLGRYVSSLWTEYYLYVPSNFSHRNDAPQNNKFLLFWRDIYSDPNTWRLGWEYTTTTATTPNSRIRGYSSRWDFNYQTNSGPNYSPTGQSSIFISPSGPLIPGNWHRIRTQVQAASNSGASDGIQKMWIDDTLYFSITNGRFWNYETGAQPVDCLLKNGYFLGWSNSGFAEETIFQISDVKFYDTNPGWI